MVLDDAIAGEMQDTNQQEKHIDNGSGGRQHSTAVSTTHRLDTPKLSFGRHTLVDKIRHKLPWYNCDQHSYDVDREVLPRPPERMEGIALRRCVRAGSACEMVALRN